MFANCAAITHIRTFPIGMIELVSDGVPRAIRRAVVGDIAALTRLVAMRILYDIS
jgi:hypothetical protein